jgi:hypothetical protein
MGAKALVQDKITWIERKNPTTGYFEKIPFLGNIKNKPKGWKVSRDQSERR